MTRRRWYCAWRTPEMSVWRGVADDQTDVVEVARLGRIWRVYVWGIPGFAGGTPCGTLKRGQAMAEGRETLP